MEPGQGSLFGDIPAPGTQQSGPAEQTGGTSDGVQPSGPADTKQEDAPVERSGRSDISGESDVSTNEDSTETPADAGTAATGDKEPAGDNSRSGEVSTETSQGDASR